MGVMSRAVLAEVRAAGMEAGLDAVGVAPAKPFGATRRHLEERKAAGLHGGMHFTFGNPARATDPGAALPGARSIVVGALTYRRAAAPAPSRPSGRVARYSWRDHYGRLQRALVAVATRLEVD